MPKSRAVGIDLGTTYSAMAWVDGAGKSALIANEEGDLLTPSVVLFEDKQVIVGKEAKKVAVLAADRVAECVKRDMGKPVFAKPIRGQYMPPEVIQSYILRKLKNDVAAKLGPDFQAIITVPAYFDEPRRKATYQAGEMAGLKVLDILNEPTAAALAFGEDQGYLTRFGAPKERIKVMVYDLGGGTFDVTLIDMQAGDLRTICTDGDVQLGGRDWDLRLVDHMAEQFVKAHGSDPRKSPESLQRMLGDAEEAKHTLSARNKTTVHVLHGDKSLDVTVTREQFEQMTADLLERTRYTTRQLLATAGVEWKDVSRVLLTGGSTRMPMVQRMLKALTQIEPDHSVSPDEAVARGASVYANYLLAAKGETGHQPDFDVTNVNAHSLGIEGIDPDTDRKRNKILIPRNSPLPVKRTTECVTKTANQRTVVVKVLEGESLEPSECSAIGRTVIRDLPPNLPKGWPVEVTYEYGVNGRLKVQAKVRGTNREVMLELERDESMSADRLSRWKNVLAGGGGLDAFDMAIQEELRQLKKESANAQPQATPRPAAPQPTAQPKQLKPVPLSGGQTQPAPPPQPTPRPASQPQPTMRPTPPPAPQQQPAPQQPAPQQPAPQQPALQKPALTPTQPGDLTPRPMPQPRPQPRTQPQPQPGGQQPTANVAFTCPHCRGTFHVPAALAGQQIKCPGCNGPLIVPGGPP